MKKISMVILLFLSFHVVSYSQLYMTRTGFIGFYSKMPLEDIRAENNQVYVAIDAGKKNIAVTLLLRGFVFVKELMQEHFNENYIESDKYPKANFVGNYSGEVSPDRDGIYKVMVKGMLTLHNTTREVETPATLEVRGGRLLGQAIFKLRPEDFNISIPSLVRDKISKEMTVNVRINCGTNK